MNAEGTVRMAIDPVARFNRLAALALTLMFVPAIAAGASGGGGAAGNARLDSLQIEIWPEYDRPAALVILRGELAADVGLPAALTLRIPASTGGPTAVAFATAKKARLLNLKYDRSEAGEFIALRFSVPERFFQVEFYDRLATGSSERAYRYLWPGDLPVGWLDLVVQEPAGSSNVSVLPPLAERSTGTDGLQYRSAQLGPASQGKPLPVEVRYTKLDPRVSVEILKLGSTAAFTEPGQPPGTKASLWPYVASGAVAVLFAAAGTAYWLWRRRRALAQGGARFCAKCGNGVAGGDRFCSGCGAALG
jgi:hypothetical protein